MGIMTSTKTSPTGLVGRGDDVGVPNIEDWAGPGRGRGSGREETPKGASRGLHESDRVGADEGAERVDQLLGRIDPEPLRAHPGGFAVSVGPLDVDRGGARVRGAEAGDRPEIVRRRRFAPAPPDR